jgi:hypothetical protein
MMVKNFLSCRYIESNGAGETDLKDVFPLYTCDLVASCGFGMDLGPELHSESEFMRNAKRVFYLGPWKLFKFLLLQTFPAGKRFLGGVTFTGTEQREYFGPLIEQTIKQRKVGIE